MANQAGQAKPIIGISSSLLTLKEGWFTGRERLFVGYDYILAVQKAGGIPVVLPVVEDCELIDSIDGLLLSGGYDVSPLEYGEEPEKGLDMVCPIRDRFEITLAKQARDANLPILGICRGHQLLNVAFGGTLYQDIGSNLPCTIQHVQKRTPSEASHTVELVADTSLQQLMADSTLNANSFHHQAIKKVAPGFRISALSKDGVIEGIENEGQLKILGVQWHPELMTDQPKMMALFDWLVQAARAYSYLSA
jgi:putative glutamine amidotransferase